MNRTKQVLLAAAMAGVLSFTPVASVAGQPAVTTVYAHGHHGSGHHSSSSGTSYYYCGGHSAHTHQNGVCPYANTDTGTYYCSGHGAHSHHNGVCPYGSTVAITRKTIKKVQKKLNRCGYHCGTPDGVMGTKTKRALKRFQRDNSLSVDGIIGQSTLTALGLSA